MFIKKELQAATLVTGKTGWLAPYLTKYTKQAMLDILYDGIQHGQLHFTESDGTLHVFGEANPDIHQLPSIRRRVPKIAVINVVNDEFYSRVAKTHDLGFSEAFMLGDFTTPDLKAVLDVWLDNRETLGRLQSTSARLFSAASGVFNRFFGQTMSNAKLNAIAGYDTCNALFEAFLGDTMMYSSALWDDDLGGPRGDIELAEGIHEAHETRSTTPDSGYMSDDAARAKGCSLETAQLPTFKDKYGTHTRDQLSIPLAKASDRATDALDVAAMRKVRHMLSQARAQPGDRVLEFGSGWGAMAIEAARMGCHVDTLTLSIEQKKLAEDRIAAAGFSDMVRVHLLDYRELPTKFPKLHHAFDAFVCSEMIEHVGEQHHAEFFQILDWALKSHNAGICITATSRPEHRYSLYQAEDYGRRYQWPNTFLPSATSLAETVQRAVPKKFVLQSVVDQGVHYPRTLREWSYRFERNWTPELVEQMQAEQPQLCDEAHLAAFRRKWEYMFVYAEVGFARAYTSENCWTFVRPEYPQVVCD